MVYNLGNSISTSLKYYLIGYFYLDPNSTFHPFVKIYGALDISLTKEFEIKLSIVPQYIKTLKYLLETLPII